MNKLVITIKNLTNQIAVAEQSGSATAALSDQLARQTGAYQFGVVLTELYC